MNDLIAEWIARAEEDFRVAVRESKVADDAGYNVICNLAQQCIEKYMTAALTDKGVVPPKIHDLVQLHRLLAPVCPEWDWPVDELRLLSRCAVAFRYPGELAGQEEAMAAISICRGIRARLRSLLGLSVQD